VDNSIMGACRGADEFQGTRGDGWTVIGMTSAAAMSRERQGVDPADYNSDP